MKYHLTLSQDEATAVCLVLTYGRAVALQEASSMPPDPDNDECELADAVRQRLGRQIREQATERLRSAAGKAGAR